MQTRGRPTAPADPTDLRIEAITALDEAIGYLKQTTGALLFRRELLVAENSTQSNTR